MLVIVKYGDVAALLEPALYLEAARSGYVLKVHAAEGLGDKADRVHDLVYVFAVDADRHRVNVTEGLEQHALSLHNGHGGLWPDVTESEHCRSIGYDGHHVPAAGKFKTL